MSHRPSPPPPQVIDLPGQSGITIRALDWGGDGPPVVLLHPNGFCGGLYEPIAHCIAAAARPIALDLRGHGGSTAPDHPGAYRFENLAIDVSDPERLPQSVGDVMTTFVVALQATAIQ